MGDVLVGVAARREAPIQPLKCAPAPAVVIGGTQNQPPAGLQHTGQLVEGFLLRRDVLDDLRTDDAVEGAIGEGQLEDGTVDQRVAVA